MCQLCLGFMMEAEVNKTVKQNLLILLTVKKYTGPIPKPGICQPAWVFQMHGSNFSWIQYTWWQNNCTPQSIRLRTKVLTEDGHRPKFRQMISTATVPSSTSTVWVDTWSVGNGRTRKILTRTLGIRVPGDSNIGKANIKKSDMWLMDPGVAIMHLYNQS